jgi:eukaryotic-like serine/threonine-protein kinase
MREARGDSESVTHTAIESATFARPARADTERLPLPDAARDSEPGVASARSHELANAESAAESFALQRERVLSRNEHSASVHRLRQALTLGMPIWLGSLLLDAGAVLIAGAGPFSHFVLARLSCAVIGCCVVWRLRRPVEPTPRALAMMDLGTFTLASAGNAWLALCFGGIVSPYAAGLLVILVARGSTTLEPRRRGAWMLGIPALAYPVVLLAAALGSERVAAQFRDPVQLYTFLVFLCFVAMTCLHLTSSADFAWRLRRQALESRNIGRYRLERRLGRGGMADVWAAYDVALGHRVALKIVTGHRPGSSALERLEREARALAGLTHPNTVRVFDYGVTEDGLWYYAMELLTGDSLRDLVAHEGPLPHARLLHIARQVLRALGEAHQKGIIHRDVKPENVFVAELGGERDVVKLLDFGIAKAIAGHDTDLTHTGWLTGTPAYMPPELILGAPADERSDIYCFGAMLYFAATGALPFRESTSAGLLAAHLNSPLPPLVSVAGQSLPAELERVVARCMAKRPADRYPSTQAVLEALAPLG